MVILIKSERRNEKVFILLLKLPKTLKKLSVVFSLQTNLIDPLYIYTCFGTFWASLFNLLNYFVWPRITDVDSVPKMRIWSLLLIISDLDGVYSLVELFIFQLPCFDHKNSCQR